MEDSPTYQKIYEKIREEIYTRTLKPGDRLPGVRAMSQLWHCTPGTVQHAYNMLVRNGLVISQQGKGTLVLDADLSQVPGKVNLRKASLVIRTEQFLLECATAGYTLEEITGALTMAAEHWRVIESAQDQPIQGTIRITGSSDTVINALAEYLPGVLPGIRFEVQVAGSMSGLMALAQGHADMAGCHLWDAASGSYNLPFIHKLLPSRQMRVITFAHRRLGLITRSGNPKQIHSLADLAKPGIRFVNRQNGSGTRVWLDAQLSSLNIAPNAIAGYENEKATHMEIAREVAEEKVDAGLGLESSARAYGLDFQLLTRERYDLVVEAKKAESEAMAGFIRWLQSEDARRFIAKYPGYETEETGRFVE